MYIETGLSTALSRSTKPSIQQTGSLQSVLQESISIAYSFAKVFMTKHFPQNGFFDRAHIHVHLPEGAVPKDGNFPLPKHPLTCRSLRRFGSCLGPPFPRSRPSSRRNRSHDWRNLPQRQNPPHWRPPRKNYRRKTQRRNHHPLP